MSRQVGRLYNPRITSEPHLTHLDIETPNPNTEHQALERREWCRSSSGSRDDDTVRIKYNVDMPKSEPIRPDTQNYTLKHNTTKINKSLHP